MSAIAGPLVNKFADVQQPDEINTDWDRGDVITVEAKTKITYKDFSDDGPLKAVMLSYEERRNNGAPCKLHFDCDDQKLVERIRNKFFKDSNICSGENNSIAIDKIRPNEALDKLSEVFSYLRDEGILQETVPEANGHGCFALPSSESYFSMALDRLLEKRDNVARQERDKIGVEPNYKAVTVQLVTGASAVWGQGLPDLTPLEQRPNLDKMSGGYSW